MRVIEDGPVRSVIEVRWLGRVPHRQRYMLPKHGTEVQVEMCVYWNEKDRMLKLALPVAERSAGRDFGARWLSAWASCRPTATRPWPRSGWRWSANEQPRADRASTTACTAPTSQGRELRLTPPALAAYAAHPIDDRPIVPQDRYTPRHRPGRAALPLLAQRRPGRRAAGSGRPRGPGAQREAHGPVLLPLRCRQSAQARPRAQR